MAQRELAKRETARRLSASLTEFTRAAWPVLWPGKKYVHNWHIDAIAEHLEAVTAGDIRRLIINIPFRCSKSSLVSVMWPAWVWTFRPEHQWLCGSYAAKLATRDNRYMRRLTESNWYRERWGDKFALTGDQNEKVRFENDKAGYRIAFGMDAGVMGDGGDTVLIDDPHDRQSANSEVERPKALETFDEAIVTRLNDPETSSIVIIMQRLHEKDLSGHLLEKGGWDHLMIPMQHDPLHPHPSRTLLGWRDPRTKVGELMWPARFPERVVEQTKTDIGPYATSGQLQQRPSPAGGGILQRSWWRKWTGEDPPTCEFYLMSLDTALKEKQTQKSDPDYSACTVWGGWRRDGAVKTVNLVLLDAWQERLPMPLLRAKAKTEYDRWTQVNRGSPPFVLVEDKSSGTSLIQELHAAGIGVWGFDPLSDDKVFRANMVSSVLQDGSIWAPGDKLPDGQKGRSNLLFSPYAEMVVAQCEGFPNAAHDDMVDTCTQAWWFMRHQGAFKLAGDKPDEEKRRKKQLNYYGISAAT